MSVVQMQQFAEMIARAAGGGNTTAGSGASMRRSSGTYGGDADNDSNTSGVLRKIAAQRVKRETRLEKVGTARVLLEQKINEELEKFLKDKEGHSDYEEKAAEARKKSGEEIQKLHDKEARRLAKMTSKLDLLNKEAEEEQKKENAKRVRDGEYRRSLANKTFNEMQAIVASKNNALKDSQKTFAESARQSKLMTAALMANHREINEYSDPIVYQQYVNDLKQSLSGVSTSYLKQQDMIDEVTGEIRENMDPSKFADFHEKLRGSLDDLESHMEKFAGAGDVGEMFKTDSAGWSTKAAALSDEKAASLGIDKTASDAGEKLQSKVLAESIEQLAARSLLTKDELTKMGLVINETTGKLTEASKQSIIDSTDESKAKRELIATEIKAKNETLKQQKKLAELANSENAVYLKGLNKDNLVAKFNKKTTELTSIAGGLALAMKGLKQGFTEASSFNVAGIAKSYLDVSLKATSMGMNFEEASKFYSENKQIAATMGNEKFDKFVKDSQLTMRELGYTDKQSAEFVTASSETAKQAGVDMKDANAMNKFVKDSAKAFKELGGITSLTAGEFQKMRAEIASNVDIQSVSIGMTAEQTALRMKENDATYRSLMLAGLTDEQAKRQILANAQEARMKVSDKITKAAMLKMSMQRLGMSAEDSEFARRTTMLGTNASTEDQTKLKALMAETTRRSAEELKNTGTNEAAYTAIQSFQENTMDKAQLGTQEQRDLIVAQKANAGVKDADKTNKDAKGSETFAKVDQMANVATAIASSALFALAAGAAMATAGLLMNAKATGGLGTMMGKVGDILKGGAGKAGGLWQATKTAVTTPGLGGRLAAGAGQAAQATRATIAGGTAAAGTAAQAAKATLIGATAAAGTAASSAANAAKAVLPAVKVLGPALSAVDVYSGMSDLSEGKRQTEMPTWLDALSPMKWGMYIGDGFNKIAEGSDGKGQSIGSRLYDVFNDDPMVKMAEEEKKALAARAVDRTKNKTEPDVALASIAKATGGVDANSSIESLTGPISTINSAPLSFGETIAKPNAIYSFDNLGTGAATSTSSEGINNTNKTKSILDGDKLAELPPDEQVTYLKTIAENAIASVKILEKILAKEGTPETLLGRGSSFTDSVQSYFTGRRATGDA